MRVCDLTEKIEKIMPKNMALSWDNVGLLVGDANQQVRRVYVALDATDEVVAHAIEKKADMLLTHHPLIFSGLKTVCAQDFIGKRIIDMIQANMSYYAMHTNFDVAKMGDLAAEKLGLDQLQVLDVTWETPRETKGIGCVGTLPQAMTLEAFTKRCLEAFGISNAKTFGEKETMVQKVAICPGSGKSEIEQAIAMEADVLVTGDIDHHAGIDAVARQLAIVDGGHYGIEQIYIAYMKQLLEEIAPEIEVFTEEKQEPFWVVTAE